MEEVYIIRVAFQELYYYGLTPNGTPLLIEDRIEAHFLPKDQADKIKDMLDISSDSHFVVEPLNQQEEDE